MAQKALFPMKYLRCTQDENSTYSHAGSLAMDFGGQSGATDDKLYAPFDMVCRRVRTDSSHEMYFESTGPVECADGTVGIVHMTVMHDNYINGNVRVGNVIKPGEYFADEGGFGGGRVDKFARHTHIEAGKGKSPACQAMNAKGTHITSPQSHLYDIFFIAADTTMLSGKGNHTWKKTTDKLLDTSGNSSAVTQTSGQTATLAIGPMSSGDESSIKALCAKLSLPVKTTKEKGHSTLTVGPMSAGDILTLTNEAVRLKLGIAEKKDFTLTIGPVSSGDEKTIKSLAVKLALPVKASRKNSLAALTIGPMSVGDLNTVSAESKRLNLTAKPV